MKMPDVNGEQAVGPRKDEIRVSPEEKREMAEYLEQQIREARAQQKELDRTYPYMDGGRTVLGPEIFTDGRTVCWKGENYLPQSYVEALRNIRAVAAIHCSALVELLHDEGIQLPQSALRVYQLLYDELTLTMPALANAHPAVLPRLPEGME
jgi:hypothetical protein